MSYAGMLLVLLPLFSVGVYIHYPQTLAAIGLGGSREKTPARVPAVSPVPVDALRPAGLPQSFLPEREIRKEISDTGTGIDVDFLPENSPEDYHALVDPMDVSIAELFDLQVKTIAIDPDTADGTRGL